VGQAPRGRQGGADAAAHAAGGARLAILSSSLDSCTGLVASTLLLCSSSVQRALSPQIDTDNSGTISFAELLRFSQRQLDHGRREQNFQMWKTNIK
jgi:hypothetical protein